MRSINDGEAGNPPEPCLKPAEDGSGQNLADPWLKDHKVNCRFYSHPQYSPSRAKIWQLNVIYDCNQGKNIYSEW